MEQDRGLIKRIIEISRRPEFLGKIIFLENYDMQLARRLVSGVDIWLNTPTRPLEASGTSGEKALMNGVVNFSVLDGWWLEGYREGAGWALTEKRTYQNQNTKTSWMPLPFTASSNRKSCRCTMHATRRDIPKAGSEPSRTPSHRLRLITQ